MYRSIYLPLDNSDHSLAGVDLAIALARASGATLVGSHVYAAKLHDRRFRQMEGGLPEPYRKEEKLVEQREIHDDLITRGLEVITDSYLDVFSARCTDAGLEGQRVSLEGRNWQRLVEDISARDCDLVVMGALGLGAVAASQLGSVTERVARRIDRDLLVVRETQSSDGPIMAALDGSPQSWGALKTALDLGFVLGRPVEAISAFDPQFHYVAFNSIAKVLSPAAASVFRFEEQEKLHEEIIDSGLAKIYQGHLEVAQRLAAEQGIAIKTTLLSGKAFEQVLGYARERRPWLIVLGRVGVHSSGGLDLGSLTENLLRLAPCNLLISARSFEPPAYAVADVTIAFTEEAEARMSRVPDFVRGMARKAVVRHALDKGHTVVTSDVIDACLKSIPDGAVERHAAKNGRSHMEKADGGKCPFAHAKSEPASSEHDTVNWEPAALARLEAIEPASVREHARLRLVKMARSSGRGTVSEELMDQVVQAISLTLG
jgi:nucleotide-binding universal stress UspA family protein